MKECTRGTKLGVERRLEFIDFRLFWEGGVNCSDIIDMFDMSVPYTSKDLTPLPGARFSERDLRQER